MWGSGDNLTKFTKTVYARLLAVKTLSKVVLPGAKEPFEWLISETAYNVSGKLAEKGVRGICAVAFDEASEDVLEARKKLLRTDVAMSLRQSLWLGINRELTSNPRTVNGIPRRFSWWDRISDNLVTSDVGQGLYSEEVAVEVGKCLAEDGRDLQVLGDYLTSSRALVNNRDASVAERAIATRTKELVDALLEVLANNDLYCSI